MIAHHLKDDGDRLPDDGRNRDKVWEAKRRPNYKSVRSGIFGSDFSLKCGSRIPMINIS
jgi:hypothetical protein